MSPTPATELPPVLIPVPAPPKWVPRARTEAYLNAGATEAILGTLHASAPRIDARFFWQGVWSLGAAAVALGAAAAGVGSLVTFGGVFLLLSVAQFALHTHVARRDRAFEGLFDEVRGFALDRAGDTLIRLMDLPRDGRAQLISLMLRLASAREGAALAAAVPGRWTGLGEEKFTRALLALGAYAVALRDGRPQEGPGGLGMARARAADAVAECCAAAPPGLVPRADVARLERAARA